MKFKDLKLSSDNHFIAMQYFGLILNRTYLVLLNNDQIIGLKVNGLVSTENNDNILAKELSNKMAIKGNLQNPYSYIKSKYLDNLQNLELTDVDILKQNKSNFIIQKSDIANAYHDPKKKWGMGYYPHDGKIYIVTKNEGKKELIILGDQSGQKITSLILSK